MPKKKTPQIFAEANLHAGGATLRGTAVVETPQPLPADHPFYRDVGRVSSAWSHIEHTLDLIIWDIAEIQGPLGACITSQIMGVGPRCKSIITLCSHLNYPSHFAKHFRKLMNESYPLADLRARVVHDPWYAHKDGAGARQFKAMPYSDPRWGIKDVNRTEIESILEKIKGLQNHANNLREQILDARRALRGKQS